MTTASPGTRKARLDPEGLKDISALGNVFEMVETSDGTPYASTCNKLTIHSLSCIRVAEDLRTWQFLLIHLSEVQGASVSHSYEHGCNPKAEQLNRYTVLLSPSRIPENI